MSVRRSALIGGGLVAASAVGFTVARGAHATGLTDANLDAALGAAAAAAAGYGAARVLASLPQESETPRVSDEAREQARLARDRARGAMRALGGRRYRRPCYLLLGPSGVGKT